MFDLDGLLKQLSSIKDSHGEAAFEDAKERIARAILRKGPQGEEILRGLWPDLDYERLKSAVSQPVEEPKPEEPKPVEESAPGAPPLRTMPLEDAVMEAFRKQMPNMTSQAHFNAFTTAYDAFRQTADAYFKGDNQAASDYREALNKALDVMGRFKEIQEKIQEIPEEDQQAWTKTFTASPEQYQEEDLARDLQEELHGIRNLDDLNSWYAKHKPSFDRLVSQSRRNRVFDAIRQKRNTLSGG